MKIIYVRNFLLCMILLVIIQCKNRDRETVASYPEKPQVPPTIKKEHEYLLGRLTEWVSFQDSTGKAAKKLEELMQHHFTEEENSVLPPLGLLQLLATGKLPPETGKLTALIEQFKSNSNHLIAEHQLIKAFMDELKEVAAKENHPGVGIFMAEVQRHAMTEEEIFFPATLLIGEFLKLKIPTNNSN